MKISIYRLVMLMVFALTIAAQDRPKVIVGAAKKIDSINYARTGRKPPGLPSAIGWNKVENHFEDTFKWCVVTTNIISPPQPLVPAKIVITIMQLDEFVEKTKNYDLEFVVGYPTNHVDLLSDNRFMWEAPRRPGDQFTIDLEFIPLESGIFNIYLLEAGEHLMDIEWCLDGDGSLTYLRNKRIAGISPFKPVTTLFFDRDFVEIKHPGLHGVLDKWDCQMRIEPSFAIGEISTVTYYLTPKDVIYDGIDFRFNGEHMEIVKYPDIVNYTIGIGETIELSVDVIPASVRNLQKLILRFDPVMERGSRGTDQVLIPCFAVFHDDGSLRFVRSMDMRNLDTSMLPSSYPNAEDAGGFRSKIIYKNRPHPYSAKVK